MGEFCSKGVGGTGLGLGIAGTALGVLNGGLLGGNGLLGGLFGNNNNNANNAWMAANSAALAADTVGIASNARTMRQDTIFTGIIAEKDSKIARLEAERYADHIGIDTYKAAKDDNNALADRLLEKYINPMATEICDAKSREAKMQAEIECMQKTADLREQLVLSKVDAVKQDVALREQILVGKIQEVACQANNGLTALNGQMQCLQNTVNQITKTVVPISNVCPQPISNNAYVYQNPCKSDCGCGCNS